jgi:ABC-type transport system involved in multi-copper enzyme maturation permease subunit
MNTPTPADLTRPAARPSALSFGRILRSEWIKLRSLPSTVILLGCAVVVMVALGMLGAWGMTAAAADGQPVTDAHIQTLPSGGLAFGQLVIGSLAVLLIASEFATGMIRSTMIAVPTRRPAFLGKALVISAVAFLVGTGSATLTYVAIQPVLAARDFGFGLEGPVAGSLACTGLYLVLIALMGLGLGTLLRSSAGAIVTLAGLLLVLPTALGMIPGEAASTVAKYLPSKAGAQLTATQIADDALTQLQGGLVLGAWALVPFLAAAVLIRRRDV